jgi:hypothetical protein
MTARARACGAARSPGAALCVGLGDGRFGAIELVVPPSRGGAVRLTDWSALCSEPTNRLIGI